MIEDFLNPDAHKEGCRTRLKINGAAVPVECVHGLEYCRMCDPCICEESHVGAAMLFEVRNQKK